MANKVFHATKSVNTREPSEFTSYALVGLRNFYNNYPQKFTSRLSKGPPTCYRWLAWKFVGRLVIQKQKNRYKSLVEEGEDNKWLHDIDKDLSRTYPTHPLFDVNKFGLAGQKILRNILQAYAVYNPDVGYC